jgi:hypothetical protein
MKFSRELIDLRHKERLLVGAGYYEEAQLVKNQADQQEDRERKKIEFEVSS